MIHKLLAGKGRMKRAVSLLLCLALLGSSVISTNVAAAEADTDVTTEAESEVTVEVDTLDAENTDETTTASTEAQSIDSSGSTEETTSDAVTETSTETVIEVMFETTMEGIVEPAVEEVTETVSESSGDLETESRSVETESSTLSLGSSASATSDDGISLAATYSGYTVTVGGTTTINSSDITSANFGTWSSSDTSIATVSRSGNTVTIAGVSTGTATITHTYRSGWSEVTDTYTVTVTGSGTSSSNTVTVYVYVAGSSLDGVKFSQEMLDLLGVESLDAYGYFSAGTIELDMSQLSGTANSKIATQDEWDYVLGVLGSSLDTTSSISNSGNTVASYADQVLIDIGATQGSMYSGLWVSYGADDMNDVGGHVNANGTVTTTGQYRWHLDIRFNTVKITYIYGNNGITEGDEKDGNTAVNGEKVYIQGATLDLQPTVTAPDGYKIAGYYTDPNFTTEWEDITGSPIDEDITVYIKLVPLSDVTINYVVQEGIGTVTDPSNYNATVQKGAEYFDPVSETPAGSTATAGDGYEFEGWYSDEALTNKVSSETNYVPSAPAEGWIEGAEYTYYAKFVPVKTTVTVNKVWKDNGNASLRPDSVTVELYAGDETTEITAEITSADSWTYTFTGLNKYSYNDDGTLNEEISYTVREQEVDSYTSAVTKGTDGIITVTNTLSTATVTIKKVVSGNMGDTSRSFKFTVKLSTSGTAYVGSLIYAKNDGNEASGETDANGEWSISLKHNEYVTVTVPYGYTIEVTEDNYSADGYTTTYAVNGGDTNSDSTYTNTGITTDTSLVFTNNKTVSAPTGITRDVAPYGLALGLALGGAVLMFVSRRRRV